MPRPVHLVVDTGVDDALAIVAAVLHPELHLTGATASAGNVSLPQALHNTRVVLSRLGAAHVPLSRGSSARHDGVAFEARAVHGRDGLAGLAGPAARGENAPPMPHVDPATTIVCLAPLTSLVPLRPGHVVASYARPDQANYAMDRDAADRVRQTWRVRDVTPQADLDAWGVDTRAGGVTAFVDALVSHQRNRGAGLGDAEAVLALAGSDDPLADLARLLGR